MSFEKVTLYLEQEDEEMLQKEMMWEILLMQQSGFQKCARKILKVEEGQEVELDWKMNKAYDIESWNSCDKCEQR